MERFLIICVQLGDEKKNYDSVDACVKNFGRWWHHIKNVWILKTSRTIDEITNEIMLFLSPDDSLLVSIFSENEYNGYLTQNAYDWIENQKKEQ